MDAETRQGLPPPSPPRLLSGWALPGVPGDLRAVDEVVPPVPPSAAAVDILVISRTADLRASAPLTWWTS